LLNHIVVVVVKPCCYYC